MDKTTLEKLNYFELKEIVKMLSQNMIWFGQKLNIVMP